MGLLADEAQDRAALEIQRWRREGIDVLIHSDPLYPRRLASWPGAPALLFARGDLTPGDADGVAVIGTREPSRSGRVAAQAVARALVDSGRTVVSGLATGIDAETHRAALGRGGRSVAVLGNGVDQVYPAANAQLQDQMTVLVSQFRPEATPNRRSFPARNAVMSAMTVATVIVEAGERSGARIQARHAVAQGRQLFLMAPVLAQAWAAALIEEGHAVGVDTAADLIDELNR